MQDVDPVGVWHDSTSPRAVRVREMIELRAPYELVRVEELRGGVMVLFCDERYDHLGHALLSLDPEPDEVASKLALALDRYSARWQRYGGRLTGLRPAPGGMWAPSWAQAWWATAAELDGWPDWDPIVTPDDLRRHYVGFAAHHEAHHAREDRMRAALAALPPGLRADVCQFLSDRLAPEDRQRFGL